MAGRWRSAQRRKRWTDHAALLPEAALPLLEPWPALQPFAKQLEAFGEQHSTYAQLALVKTMGNNLLGVLQLGEKEVTAALRVYVELLFVENSRPLHRGLLSALTRVPSSHSVSLRNAFLECCQEYGSGGGKQRKFSVVAVSASLASMPQPGLMKEITHCCAPSMSNSLRQDVQSVLQHALEGGRPTPSAMEECQDALSSIYYLIQQFPDKFQHSISHERKGPCFEPFSAHEEVGASNDSSSRDSDTPEFDDEKNFSEAFAASKSQGSGSEDRKGSSQNGGFLYGAIVCCLLDVLQTAVLSRDCLVAAGVGLAAAAQLSVTKEGLAVVLASTAFSSPHYTFAILSPDAGLTRSNEGCGSLENAIIVCRNSNLEAEMKKLSDFGKLCFFRGILTAIPRNTQNVHLLRTSTSSNGSEFGVASYQQEGGGHEELQPQAWTLLYDGILPALCGFCESSVDSHFKFHAATAMQICLQQIKTSIFGNLTHSAFKDFEQAAIRHNISVLPYDPLPPASISQVLQLIWNNWEDPLTQTVKQVQVVFDLLIDVQLVHKRVLYENQSTEKENVNSCDTTKSEMDDVGTDSFLRQIACDLLAAGRYRKGKYVPLASLVLRIGARKMLLMSPDLLFQTIDAFSDDDVCSCASTFLKTFLERLKEDCWSAEGIMEGTVVARRSWIPALFSGLLTGNPRLRNNLTTYALPVAMQIDTDSLPLMLAYILDGHNKTGAMPGSSLSWDELKGAKGLPGHLAIEQQVVLLISVLKVARSLALVEGSIEQVFKPVDAAVIGEVEDDLTSTKISLDMSDAMVCIKGQTVEFPVNFLLLALTHKEDGLRVDTAELMCLNPKTASMPSHLELHLLRIALPLNMRCSSTAFRMRWTSFLKKFFLRVRTAVERQQKAENLRMSQLKQIETPSSLNMSVAIRDRGESRECLIRTGAADEHVSQSALTLEQMQDFMQWLSQMLVSSLYPSAPYERKNMAMEVFNALIDVWSLKQSWEKRSGRYTSSPYLDTVDFCPYHESLLSVDFTLVIVGAVVDSWDRLREGAYRILIQYPTPLPGLDSESDIEGLLKWAKGMVNSPRVRESDAGALAFRLVFRKYVLELGWSVKVHPEPKVVIKSIVGTDSSFAQGVAEVVQYLESLCDWLQWGIEEGDRDLLKACTHSFVHGVLLVLRYTVEEIDWTSVGVQSCSGNLRTALGRLLGLLLRVTSLALWVVSADALNLQEKLGGQSPSGSMIPENDPAESDVMPANGEAVDDEYDSDVEESLAPAEQMVMVGCWLSVKEVGLLLGTMARVVPLPGSPPGDIKVGRVENYVPQRRFPRDASKSDPMLDGKQLEAIGGHFVQVLLSMKHNGAIDKTRTGFIALCDRLLRSSDPWLNKLPEIWLQQLMDHTGAKGQVVDDLLRRSAGIPPAFLALFLAEPDGSPKKLLPIAMRWLIDTCKGFLLESCCQSEVTQTGLDLSNKENDLLVQNCSVLPVNGISEDYLAQLGENGEPVALKSRDEGVVPTVHAFNVLRMTFHDTNLATDTSGFCAEGLITAIQAFASSYWEVRNSATLAFTALVHRTIGFLNVYKRESARRAITGFEFFHRYPTLHPFLLRELQTATWQLEHGEHNGANKGGGLASLLHPSLCPVLIILSRLKPSFIDSDVEDWLNPSAFMPYVTKCATQRNLHVRVLASRALAPLVSSEDLSAVLLQLAHSLPLIISRKELELVTTKQKHGSGVNQVFSFNAIHGVLLQMYILLTSNCTSLPDLDQQSRIVMQLSQTIEERLWLGSIRFCGCYVVIGSFLDVLCGLLSLAKLCQENLSQPLTLINRLQLLLSELSCECLDDSTQDLKLRDSTRIALRDKAAKLYFQTMLTRGSFWSFYDTAYQDFAFKDRDAGIELPIRGDFSGKSGLQVCSRISSYIASQNCGQFVTRLKQALVDNNYEVRLATLKVLKKYYGLPWEQSIKAPHWGSDESSSDISFLRPLIIERLRVETHPLCIHRILQVIYAWTLIDKGHSETQVTGSKGHPQATIATNSVWGSGLSAQELWCFLLKIYNTSKQLKTREVAVRCLGGCLQQIRAGIVDGIKSNSLMKGSNSLQKQYFAGGIENGHLEPSSNMIPCVAEKQDRFSMKEIVNLWLGVANVHSAASEPVNFRRATAEAIVASGILVDAEWTGLKLTEELQEDGCVEECGSLPDSMDLEWYAKTVLSAWRICIKLLEDEDVDLRQKLALSILNVVARSETHTSNAVPAQVEKVIQVSFDFLSAQFGHWREYYDLLAEWILGSVDDTNVIGGDVDLVRRLFDKEIDNHHEEELLFVQLCCLHLEKLRYVSCKQAVPSNGVQSNLWTTSKRNRKVQQQNSSSPLPDDRRWPVEMSRASWYDLFSLKWRTKYLKRARLCARLCVQINDSMQWVGGVTNHQDTFKSLYRSLLGLIYVCPKQEKSLTSQADSPDDDEFVRGLAEVSELLRQLPLNPLVSNALVQVLQTYEKQQQVRLGSSDIRAELRSAFIAKFSPLFLVG